MARRDNETDSAVYLARLLRYETIGNMSKTAAKRRSAKKKSSQSGKRAVPKKTKQAKTSSTETSGDKLTLNHAMIYVKDVARAVGFYRDLLGLKLIDDFRHEGVAIYARLRAPGGDGTIALHMAGPGASVASEGVRLYFEIRELDEFCRKLQQRGFYINQMPRMMPWGWRHAYINDPDGHEISLYWAGANRMKKTVMKTAQQAAKN